MNTLGGVWWEPSHGSQMPTCEMKTVMNIEQLIFVIPPDIASHSHPPDINGRSRNNPTIFSQMAVFGPSGTMVPRRRKDFPIMGFVAVFGSCCHEKYRLIWLGVSVKIYSRRRQCGWSAVRIYRICPVLRLGGEVYTCSLEGSPAQGPLFVVTICFTPSLHPKLLTNSHQLPLSRLLWVLPAPRSKTRGRKAWWKCWKL